MGWIWQRLRGSLSLLLVRSFSLLALLSSPQWNRRRVVRPPYNSLRSTTAVKSAIELRSLSRSLSFYSVYASLLLRLLKSQGWKRIAISFLIKLEGNYILTALHFDMAKDIKDRLFDH